MILPCLTPGLGPGPVVRVALRTVKHALARVWRHALRPVRRIVHAMAHQSRTFIGTACHAALPFAAAGLLALAPPSQARLPSVTPFVAATSHPPNADTDAIGPDAWPWGAAGTGGGNEHTGSGSIIVTQVPGPIPAEPPASVILAPYLASHDIPPDVPGFDSSLQPGPLQPVPEPASMLVLGVPLTALILIQRRRAVRGSCRTLGPGV